MTIETRYDYTYYTVIDIEQWRRGNEDIWGDEGFTWAKAIDFINHKFITSKDKSVNNYRVDYAGYEQGAEQTVMVQDPPQQQMPESPSSSGGGMMVVSGGSSHDPFEFLDYQG